MKLAWLILALAPTTAWCRDVVTNVTDLLPCLGYDGKEGIEFSLRGTVVWAPSPLTQAFCVKTDGNYVRLISPYTWQQYHLAAGDIIHAHGKTIRINNGIANGFVNADCLSIEITGHVEPEQPIDTTIGDILTGRHHFYPVRIQGTVRDVFIDEIDHGYQHVVLSADRKSIAFAIPIPKDSATTLGVLVGAEVRVTGSCLPASNGFRHLSQNVLYLHSTNEIEIITPPPCDPFAVPPIRSIHLDETAAIMNLGRHSAKGVVIAVWQKRDFAIKTDDGSIVNINLADSPPPAGGDMVDVAGLPDTDLYRINLRRAIWRKQPGSSRQELERAEPMDAATLFSDGKGHNEINPIFHGKAISLRGLVTGVPSAGMNDGIVRLQCGDFAMPVDASATPDAVKSLEIGCEAEISGTCIVKTDSWHPNEPLPRIRDVVLVVRGPSDVKILAPPPWWTPGRFLVLVAVLLAALVAFILWNVLLRRLADKRGRELMRTQLSQEESKLKVQERTRIAVELHDTIAQNLTGVSLEIDSAEQLAAKNPDAMLKHLGMAARTLQSCRNELRNCLWDLRSRALEEADLNEAIRRTIAPLVSDVDLAIRFNVPRKALSDDIAHVLMRIVRELVQNAVRHGGASQVKIAGSLDGDSLRFSVNDNGRGFDPATRPGVMQGHFGLQGIHERVNQLNGELSIESAPGKGAKVSASLKMEKHK